LYPEAEDIAPSQLSQADSGQVIQQLGQLGFKPTQSQKAVEYLSKPSPLTSNLLGTLTPLEASIEYLVLNVPECDLPSRFLPATNSSYPFISSTHAGTDDLKKRWIEDKAIKEAGWPAHVVKSCTSDPRLLQSWELLILSLDKRLVGDDAEENFLPSTETDKSYILNPSEIDAFGASYSDPNTLVMPLFSAPIKLHILVSSNGTFRGAGHPPMFLTSASVSAYVRLHLLSQLLRAMKDSDFIEPEEGLLMAAMRLLEGEWAIIEAQGPPDISAVLRHLVPQAPEARGTVVSSPAHEPLAARRIGKISGYHRRDTRSDRDIKDEFEVMRHSDRYFEYFAARSRLPAFSAKDEFLNKLEKNRVVVVVGETGLSPPIMSKLPGSL
jgi:ATP-dependent RNA helicase DHX57